MTLDEHNRQHWDQIKMIVSNWTGLDRKSVYWLLHKEGERIDGIDFQIEKLLKEKWRSDSVA